MQIRHTNALKFPMTEHVPAFENLTASQIYDAIRYLEQDLGTYNTEDGDYGVVISVCLYIFMFVGLAFLLCR